MIHEPQTHAPPPPVLLSHSFASSTHADRALVDHLEELLERAELRLRQDSLEELDVDKFRRRVPARAEPLIRRNKERRMRFDLPWPRAQHDPLIRVDARPGDQVRRERLVAAPDLPMRDLAKDVQEPRRRRRD
jgi:hypothetical protein